VEPENQPHRAIPKQERRQKVAKRPPRLIEALSIHEGNQAYGGKPEHGQVRHLPDHYHVIMDDTDETGKRTIMLVPVDDSKVKRKTEEIINAIQKQVGDQGEVLKSILLDVFEDYYPEAIDRLHGRIVTKKEPVTPRPGCYKLVIGEGKGAEEIILRE